MLIKNINKYFLGLNYFIQQIFRNCDLIISLSIREFRGGSYGSLLGVSWILIEPLVYVFLLWFFFTKAMKFTPPEGYPYVPWLMSAMVLWNFISLSMTTTTTTFRSHAFLLRHHGFKMAILPIVNLLSCLYVHIIFLGILAILLLCSDIPFTVYWFQSLYYLFATSVLLLGVGWITASLSLFIKDISNINGVLLQIGFWISPIFWSLDTFPKEYQFLLKLNPISYVIEGYRKSFLYGQPMWTDMNGFFYYWSITISVLALGYFTYKKLRPHFGDVI
ncbi:ABC transporter permease [Polynucleobacter paneuropaeus]|nr:ABC transporter permease [Polynucleobacter paneuropaeus]